MSGGTFWVILVIVGIIVIVGYVVQWRLHKRKVAAFTAFAARHGWRYAERNDNFAHRYLGTPFGRGFGHRANHVLAGKHRGRELVAFEYVYKERRGDRDDRRTTTYRYTVVALATPAPRPTLQVDREGLGRKLLGLVGIRDLQLESEEFNTTFHIQAEDDKFAYDVLHPRTMEWMLGDQRCRDLPFRFERSDLLTWRTGTIELRTAMWMLTYLCDVLDRVPAFVWKG